MATVRLTDRAIKALEAPKVGQRDLWDQAIPGLGVRIGTTGRPSFVLRYRTGAGKRRRATLGTYEVMSLADARREAKQVLAAVARGEDPGAKKVLAESFDEIAELFLKRHVEPNLSESTRLGYRRIIDSVRPMWGSLPISEIRRAHVIELLDQISDRGAIVQANRTRAVLHSLFQWALGRDLLEVNPVHGVPRPGPEPRRDRVLDYEEIRALWKCTDSEAEPVRSLVRFLLLTGQRNGETRRMQWEHVDWKEATWSIPGPERKGGRPHTVPLSGQALQVLRNLREAGRGDGCVFESPTKKGAPVKWLAKATARIRERAGFHFRPHDLRRTAASGMAALGVDRETLGKVLGHKSADAGVIGIYDRYGREPEKRAALEAWGTYLADVVAGKAGRTEVERAS